jgi:hypothetical protein
MPGRFRRVDEIAPDQAAVVGANIRVLRQRHGWNQAKVGELMGWFSNSTVYAAEGHRNGRQVRLSSGFEFGRVTVPGLVPGMVSAWCAGCGWAHGRICPSPLSVRRGTRAYGYVYSRSQEITFIQAVVLDPLTSTGTCV